MAVALFSQLPVGAIFTTMIAGAFLSQSVIMKKVSETEAAPSYSTFGGKPAFFVADKDWFDPDEIVCEDD